MADRSLDIPLDVREDLDTAMPISDRKHGVLVVAKDVSSRYWGPRAGPLAFTQIMEAPGTAALYDLVTFDGTGSTYTLGYSNEDQFTNLGVTFTLDIWFRLGSLAGLSTADSIGLYQLDYGWTNPAISVSIRGPNHTDHEKIRVELTTSASRSTQDGTVGFTGSTRIGYGSNQTDIQHIRIVRNGATATLYLNGVSDGSTSSLSASHPMQTTYGSYAGAFLCKASAHSDNMVTLYTNTYFNGAIYGAVLRDGAYSAQPIEARMPCNPFGKGVHHYYLGRKHDLGGADHLFDASRYGLHPRIVSTGYTVTSSNFNPAPAPCSVQGIRSWTTRTSRVATSVMAGGILSTAVIS